MTEPIKPAVRHDGDGQTIISGVTLVLTSALHQRNLHTQRAGVGADALTKLANGETVAALGAALSSLLDLIACGQPAAATEALAISQELAQRITLTRSELRAGL